MQIGHHLDTLFCSGYIKELYFSISEGGTSIVIEYVICKASDNPPTLNNIVQNVTVSCAYVIQMFFRV